MNRKKLLSALTVIICLGFVGYGYYRYDKYKRDEAYKQAEESLVLSFKESDELHKEFDGYLDNSASNIINLEYGKGTIDTSRFIKEKTGESISIEPEKIDLHQTGETTVKYTITTQDSYGKEAVKEYEYKVNVTDSQYPSIEIDEVWKQCLLSVDELDLDKNILSVSDPVDGDLKYSEHLTNGTYTVEMPEFLEDAYGDYFVLVTARDSNGNESYNGYVVTIAGTRLQSDEEKAQFASLIKQYEEEGANADTLPNSVSRSKSEENLDPSLLNGIWNGVANEDNQFFHFRINEGKVSEFGETSDLDIVIKETDRTNVYEFVFSEGTEEKYSLYFHLASEDELYGYYMDDDGNMVGFANFFRVYDDHKVKEQTSRYKAWSKVNVNARFLIENFVADYKQRLEEQKRIEEERRKAREAYLASHQAQQNGSSSSDSSQGNQSNVDVSSYPGQVLNLINQERAASGLGSISMTGELNAAAQRRAEEISSYYSHTRPDGSSCFTVFDEFGISVNGAGENIAAGQTSPGSVMNTWMNSEGHRANILNDAFTNVGIGCVYVPGSEYGYYWVQLFAAQ